jgi:hypothetical protein
MADIISQGTTNVDYQGWRDNIFDKVFRGVKKTENIEKGVEFIFSRIGFTKEAEEYCKEKEIH